jgi:hypothetical protein
MLSRGFRGLNISEVTNIPMERIKSLPECDRSRKSFLEPAQQLGGLPCPVECLLDIVSDCSGRL